MINKTSCNTRYINITSKYSLRSHRYDGLTVFVANGKEGLINKKGEMVVPPIYNIIEKFR